MQIFVANREGKVIYSTAIDIPGGAFLHDESDGHILEIVNNCLVSTYTFVINARSPEAANFVEGNYVIFRDKFGKDRLHTIMTISGTDELTVKTEDAGLDLINEIKTDIAPELAQNIEHYVDYVLEDTPWTPVYEGSIPTTTRLLDLKESSALEMLQEICMQFGVECYFETELNGLYIKSQIVHFTDRIGSEVPVKRYENDINLISLEREGDISDLFTAIKPIGSTVDDKEVTIDDIEYDDGTFYSPKKANQPEYCGYIFNVEARKQWGRLGGDTYSDKNTFGGYILKKVTYEATTPGDLFNLALNELKTYSAVKRSYRAGVQDLDGVGIGDNVDIIDTSLHSNTYLRTRVQRMYIHYSNPYIDECEFANYQMLTPRPSDSVMEIVNRVMENLPDTVVKESVTTEYAASESATQAPSSGWSTSIPAQEGTYLWCKVTFTYTDGTSNVSYVVVKNGTSGLMINDIRTQWALSDSEEEYTGTEDDWEFEQPMWTNETYIWKRDLVYWSDGSVRATNMACDKAVTQVNETTTATQQTVHDTYDIAAATANSVASAISAIDNVRNDINSYSTEVIQLYKLTESLQNQIKEAQRAADEAKANALKATAELTTLAQFFSITSQTEVNEFKSKGLDIPLGAPYVRAADGTLLLLTSNAVNFFNSYQTSGVVSPANTSLENVAVGGFFSAGAHTAQFWNDTEWDATTETEGTGLFEIGDING